MQLFLAPRGWRHFPPALQGVNLGFNFIPFFPETVGMVSVVQSSLHHSLFVGGFAGCVYGQDLLVVSGVAGQGDLQLHFLVGFLPRFEQMHVIAHRNLRNK